MPLNKETETKTKSIGLGKKAKIKTAFGRLSPKIAFHIALIPLGKV